MEGDQLLLSVHAHFFYPALLEQSPRRAGGGVYRLFNTSVDGARGPVVWRHLKLVSLPMAGGEGIAIGG